MTWVGRPTTIFSLTPRTAPAYVTRMRFSSALAPTLLVVLAAGSAGAAVSPAVKSCESAVSSALNGCIAKVNATVRKCYRDACDTLKKFGMFHYQVSSSFNYLKPEDIDVFGASNIRTLLIGFQHTDAEVLRSIGRGRYNPDKAAALIEKCRSNKIRLSLDFLLGCRAARFKKTHN